MKIVEPYFIGNYRMNKSRIKIKSVVDIGKDIVNEINENVDLDITNFK